MTGWIGWSAGRRAEDRRRGGDRPRGRVPNLAPARPEGRPLALRAEQDEGAGASATLRGALGDGVEPRILADRRILALKAGRGRSARVWPLGLPPALPDRARIRRRRR